MPDWQTIAAILCVVLAGHFVVRRLLKMSRGKQTHACGSCASNRSTQPKAKPIVPLENPDQRR